MQGMLSKVWEANHNGNYSVGMALNPHPGQADLYNPAGKRISLAASAISFEVNYP